MDFVKREQHNIVDDDAYKAYAEAIQKSQNHVDMSQDYQHTTFTMEQLHQAVQSTLNANPFVHNFPLSPRQMSTLMLKTNPLGRSLNFNDVTRNMEIDMDMAQNLGNEIDLPQNLGRSLHEEILSQNLSRNLTNELSRELSLQNSVIVQQNLIQQELTSQDLRSSLHIIRNISDVLPLNLDRNEHLAQDLNQNLDHGLDLSHHLNRSQNIDISQLNIPQEDLRRSPIVIPSLAQNSHIIDQRLGQGLGTMNLVASERDDSMQNMMLPMPFQIKCEQEDEQRFFEASQDFVHNSLPGNVQAETQTTEPMYAYDNNHISNETTQTTTPVEIYTRQQANIKGEYVCYKCNEVFSSKRALKQHGKSCTEDTGSTEAQVQENTEKTAKFNCTQCPYKCNSPAILKIHERTHTGEKPFSCKLCDYKSGQKNNVAKHILVHMKEKPFRCKYCEYRCAQKNNLVVHERTHTGYKPFVCTFCDYRTVQKPNLVKHMYLHTDQKPFSCDLCSYRCVQKTNLTKHKQRHLSVKPDVGGCKTAGKKGKNRANSE